jgi:hypothetical protein
MKAYVMTTGVVFGLIVVAHVARIVAEGPRLMTDPLFIFPTVLAIALSGWAWHLVRQMPGA